MSDQGAIGRSRSITQYYTTVSFDGTVAITGHARSIARYHNGHRWWARQVTPGHGSSADPGASMAGYFSGTVTENGSAVSFARVFVFHRKTGICTTATWTDASGNFAATGLDDLDSLNYFVVALDPDGGTQYNAIIFDRLTPAT